MNEIAADYSNTLADYDMIMVVLSYVVSVVGSFTGLLLSGLIKDREGSIRYAWLLFSAVVFGGCAIWSMHFIGMLAYSPEAPITYDLGLTAISLVVPMIFTGIGLYSVNHWAGSQSVILLSGAIMGLGVASMHYTGMAAMRVKAYMSHDHAIVVLSVIIAIIASIAALWIVVNARGIFRHSSALVMGVAVCGMHYTGMSAMELTPTDMEVDYFTSALTEQVMGVTVTLVTMTVCLTGVLFGLYGHALKEIASSEV